MKRFESLNIREKAYSMSQYLIIAQNKLSAQKERIVWSKQKQPLNTQPHTIFLKSVQRNSLKARNQKNQRSLSNANLPHLIQKRDFSLQKNQSLLKIKNQRISTNNQLRSSIQAEAVISKWRKSFSGMQLLKKKNSNTLGPKISLSHFNNDPQRKSKLMTKVSQNHQQQQQLVPSISLSLSKSQSLSQQKTKKLYYSIKHYNKQEEFWLFHLQQQLSLKQVIEQFQKIELNRNVQPIKKLTMRQAYQLKKEIVFQIQQEKSLSIQPNILKLAQIALDEKEKDKFLMIGFFIELRQKLKHSKDDFSKLKKSNFTPNRQNHITFQYQKQIIQTIKQQIKTWKRYKFQDSNIINIKILSVLALHVMKLQSSMFTFQDIELISKTIKLKKKGQSIIDYLTDEDKTIHFQSLIYMIFQFYKNLYYLKLDEEMKIEQYNSLKAYIDLYESRDATNFHKFQEKYRISSVLQNIKPASVGIYPYQDSRIRNQIKFKTLQKQLNNESSDQAQGGNMSRKPKIKINKKTLMSHMNQENERKYLKESGSQSQNDQKSRSDISSQQDSSIIQSKLSMNDAQSQNSLHSLVKRRSSITKNFTPTKNKIELKSQLDTVNFKKKTSNNLKLQLKTKPINRGSIEKNQQRLKKNKQKQAQIYNSKNFCFHFILFKESKPLSGQFNIFPDEKNTLIKITVSVQEPNGFPLLFFKFENIKIFSESLNINNFQKFMWKVFKKIFVTNFMSEQNPFLMKEYNQDPQHLKLYPDNKAISNQFRLIEVVHDYLIQWIKRQFFQYKFCGKTILTPKFCPQEINKYMENLEYEHDRKLFQKRHGYLDSGSGRRAGLSPGKNHQILFNQIKNEFYINQNMNGQNSTFQSFKKQKNIMFFMKIKLSEKVQMKFVKMLFLDHVRQISIFEHGFFKHTGTSVIQQKIPLIRKIQNRSQLYRNRLIFQLQKIFNSEQRLYQHLDQQSEELLLNKKFHIEQQFEVNLTNDFKFIPVIEIKVIYEVVLKDLQLQMIKKQRLKQQKSNGLFRKKIEKDFIAALNSSQKKQVSQRKAGNSFRDKSRTVLTTFKVFDSLFLTVQFEYSWGKRYLSIMKNLQFFQIKSNRILAQNHFVYHLTSISLYKIGVILDSGTNQFAYDDKSYFYYMVKKPFLSKLNTSTVINKRHRQANIRKVNQIQNFTAQAKHSQIQTCLQQQLHFIQERLYLTLKNQKMLKFRVNNKPQYFFLQMYQTIEILNITKSSQITQPLFIYQLTNLMNSQTKYFLKSQTEISFDSSQKLTSLIDINSFTFNGQPMEPFQVPLHKIQFQNEYFEKKTKNIRKKVISEANYFFEQRVLQICNNAKNQNILISVMQKHRISKRQTVRL